MSTCEPTHEIIPDLVEDGVFHLVPIEKQDEDDYPPIDGPGATFTGSEAEIED